MPNRRRRIRIIKDMDLPMLKFSSWRIPPAFRWFDGEGFGIGPISVWWS